MTNSFQSTAFRGSARPVDTFVAPPSVQPKTGIQSLAETLAAVNPNLQKFIGAKLEETVEQEKQKGLKIAIDQVLADGDLTSTVNKVRKKDGDDSARQLVGGSIFADRAYRTGISSLYSSQFNSVLQNDYYKHKVDSVDSQGNVIQKSLREYSPNSPEFRSWLDNITKIQSDKIFDLGGEVDTTEFTTNITNAIVKINEIATENHNEFKVERIKNLSVDYLNKAAEDWLDGNREESKIHITKFINETRKLGLTGSDATDIYNGLVDNIANIGQYYVTTSDVETLDDIDDLIYGLGESIPYGNNNGNLTQHPLWKEKIEPVLESLEDESFEELTQGPKIDKFKRTIKLENKLKEINLLPINTSEERAIYKQEITKLKNNREFSDLNEVFKSNNYPYIENFTAEILNIRTNMKLRAYEDNENPLTDLGLIKNKIVDLGITDNGILTDLEQAVGIASDYKSIYQIFDNKVQPLLDDIDAFYRSRAKSNNTFNKVNLGGGVSFNLGGLDNDSYIEKYNNEQEIDNNFEAWIKENYYQIKDGEKVGGPSEADIKKWLTDERERVEKEVFGFKTESQQKIDEISNRSVNQRRGFGFGNEDDDFRESVPQLETPALGNKKFEVEPGAFSEGGVTTVDVSSGDTLSGFANDLDTSVEAIKKANGMTSDAIQIGDVLVIPEGITDPNKVDAPKFDMNTLITSKDHPFNPVREKHNFQVIYNIAKEIGIKYPELVAAQAMEETGFGKNQSAKNNFLGLQATPSEVARGESERKMTTEFRGQGRQLEEADFKTFENIKAMMMQYKKQWNDNFLSRKGIVNANSIQEAIKMLQAEDYATNPDYDKNVLRIIDRAIKEGWF